MAKLIEILLEAQMIISMIFIVLAIYQLIICIVGLTKKKINKEYNFKEHKFMAVIPAHNEENVINDILESLKRQNYNKELLDIYVIADNCTDNTDKIAKKHGVFVYERSD